MSPGEAILRSSRVFSIPKPLPEPPMVPTFNNRKSPTMTRSYPLTQAITSPLASREKGDWGFKRSLPLKTTLTTSTPSIRIKHIDSLEGVTDFASAADHTVSLEKFQELRVVLSVPWHRDLSDVNRKPDNWYRSVFEERMDFTYPKHARMEERTATKSKQRQGPQEVSCGSDLWLQSILKTCAGPVKPKRIIEQGSMSAITEASDPGRWFLEESMDTAKLENAVQEEKLPEHETAGTTSADQELADQQRPSSGEEASFGDHTSASRKHEEALEKDATSGVEEPAIEPAVRQQPSDRGFETTDHGLTSQKLPDPVAGTPVSFSDVRQVSPQETPSTGRWKYGGPWLATMTHGEVKKYLKKHVQPRRGEFRALLMKKLAEQLTANQNNAALEAGSKSQPAVKVGDITHEKYVTFLRTLRHDRSQLFDIIFEFLDMPPLRNPIGFMNTMRMTTMRMKDNTQYDQAGPSPIHPSAGIGYLRTNAFMENHPVYGPQRHRAPVLARVVFPRTGVMSAKLGMGGFVANPPSGDTHFNRRFKGNRNQEQSLLSGLTHLDMTTFGGAKAYVEPRTATVDLRGRVVLELHETTEEATVIHKESKGNSKIYNDNPLDRPAIVDTPQQHAGPKRSSRFEVETAAQSILGRHNPPFTQEQSGTDDPQTSRT